MTDSLLVGLMSGTSLDAIDAALVRCSDNGIDLLDCLEFPLKAELRAEIAAISHSGVDEIERLGVLDRQLGHCFGQAALDLLRQAGVDRGKVRAIGSHGQTIRHRPPSAASGIDNAFSLQIGDPNTIAEITGITTVADFRRRDIAAGGEGAPLVPAYHAAVFSEPGKTRAIINIGGIANISLIDGDSVSGFDSGPGNTLLDQWAQRHIGHQYDAHGSWAAEGTVIADLLERLLQGPYFSSPAPKSTGKETFNLSWLEVALAELPEQAPGDVQATLCELTAATIVGALESTGASLDDIYLCGGGAANTDLMRRIYRRVEPVYMGTTAELGCDPAWVEAAAFAWLAGRCLDGLPGNVPAVTGATGPRVLGAVFPGS